MTPRVPPESSTPQSHLLLANSGSQPCLPWRPAPSTLLHQGGLCLSTHLGLWPPPAPALCPQPPSLLMEVPWRSCGALLERGLRMPTRKHDLFQRKRQDFKINLAYGACPSSPPTHSGKRPHAPGQAGSVLGGREPAGGPAHLGSTVSPHPQVFLCKGHGTVHIFTWSSMLGCSQLSSAGKCLCTGPGPTRY